jgi:hypothetical protein
MESKLSSRGIKVVSKVIISFFALVALISFFFAIDPTAIVATISVVMLLASVYLMWSQDEYDSISLLIFFFGTTACFYFFSDVIVSEWSRVLSIAAFALLSLVLSNYLLNTANAVHLNKRGIYKITLAIIFTEIFWVLSFYNASQISKGAITAVLFFNLQSIARDILEEKAELKKFVFLLIISIILLMIIIYRV